MYRMSDRGTLNNLLTCDEVEELLPLFALGVLDADEAEAVADHLSVCPACSSQLVHFEAVSGLLGTALEPVEPSAGQRASLLDRAAALPRGARNGDARPLAPPPVVSLSERRSSSLRSWALAAAALLVISLGGLGYWVNNLIDERDEARTTASTLADFVSPDATVMPMTQMPASQYGESWGAGKMMKDANGEMIVVVEGCPPSNEDRTYVVWVGEGEDREVLGDMTIAADGSGWMPVSMPADMPTPDILGVSVIEGANPLTDLFIGEMPPA